MTIRNEEKENLIPALNIEADEDTVDVWSPTEVTYSTGEETEWNQVVRWSPFFESALDRRHFLKIMAASMGAAGLGPGLAGCVKKKAEEILPYVHTPESVVPGKPNYYSSVFTRNGYGYGVIVESHEGRPTKVEGNPRHPASLGASDVFMQAELLNLYDPDRSRVVQEQGQIRSRGEFELALFQRRQKWRQSNGRSLRLLTPQITSPSLAARIEAILRRYPDARWHQWQPVNDDNALRGARLAFGQDVTAQYHLHKADVVVQLDGDLLSDLPGSLHYARDFSRRRQPSGTMSRVYAAESTPGLIGAMADQRLSVAAPAVERLARHLAVRVTGNTELPESATPLPHVQRTWLDSCAASLQTSRGRGLVVAGRNQPAAVHALVHWINGALDNAGEAVTYHAPVVQRSEPLVDSLADLVRGMAAGEVDTLAIIDSDPVFDAPADFRFAEALAKVDFTIHMGLYFDETASQSQWHLPLSHALESWGDALAYDGVAAIQQPLIRPMYETQTPYGLLSSIEGAGWRGDYDQVREYWRTRLPDDFEQQWRAILVRGLLSNSTAEAVQPSLRENLAEELPTPGAADTGLVLQLEPDPRVWDGTYANNAWLQELPQPLTKITWGNALLISPGRAKKLSLTQGDIVEVDCGDGRLNVPICPLPGHPDGAVSLNFGYGREIAAHQTEPAISRGVGVNAYPLRRSDNLSLRYGVKLRKTGEKMALARTQHHDSMEGREPVRHATLARFLEHPDFVASDPKAHNPEHSLFPEPRPKPFAVGDYEWGMSIDLNACIGCGACTIACQAENNIPVVGRDQVLKGREMHWIRIDRYYSGHDTPGHEGEERTLFQPLLCQHCENAPCEYVCPVDATLHDSEGLNVMVYNRCIGTRDCSQNCPYKVRRFNYLEYNYGSPRTESIAPARNPDVTVRSRGVMEKCTYCLQRISGARRQAKKEMREIRDGEVLTACQQACPTRAIVFGNVNDPDSCVSEAKRHPLSYSLLAELNTRPRTTYVARIFNPDKEPPADGRGR